MTNRQASSDCASTLHKALVEATELGFEVVVTTPDQRIIPNGRLARNPHDPSRLEILIPSQFTIDPEVAIDCLFTTMKKRIFSIPGLRGRRERTKSTGDTASSSRKPSNNVIGDCTNVSIRP